MRFHTDLSCPEAPAKVRRPTLRYLLEEVAEEYDLKPSLILGLLKTAHIAQARQDFMWRARQMKWSDGSPRYSYPQIGDFLGRDHTTVIHGVRRHAERLGQSNAG